MTASSPAPRRTARPSLRNAKPVLAPARLDGERLSKRVAEMLPCSRREAEQYIEGGWVRVDGQVIEEPMHRVSTQQIELDPQASLMELLPVTLLLHKPAGYETMAGPGQGHQRVKPAHQLLQATNHLPDDPGGSRVLKRHLSKLDACVPLEQGASGLVVFTQDWRVARKLADDASVIEQELMVEVAGEVPAQVLERLNALRLADGQPLPGFKVSLNSQSDASSKLRFAVKGVHPGLVAYLCERVGLQIIGMRRQRIGRVAMLQLPPGQWRFLQSQERF